MANDKTKQILSNVGHKLKSLFVSDTPGVEPGFKKLWEKTAPKIWHQHFWRLHLV